MKYLPKILSAIVGLTVIGVAAWLAATTGTDQTMLVLTGVAAAGGLGTVALPPIGSWRSVKAAAARANEPVSAATGSLFAVSVGALFVSLALALVGCGHPVTEGVFTASGVQIAAALALALALIGLVAPLTYKLAEITGFKRRRSPHLTRAFPLLALMMSVAVGCGPSALAIHADAAAITGRAVAEADVVLISTRGRELDAIVAEAAAECAATSGEAAEPETRQTEPEAKQARTEASEVAPEAVAPADAVLPPEAVTVAPADLAPDVALPEAEATEALASLIRTPDVRPPEAASAGCSDERATYYLGRHDTAVERWRTVLDCRAPVVQAVRAWIDAIDLANTAASEELGLEHVVAEAARAVLLYAGLRECVAPAVNLPELPAIVRSYARSAAQ